MPVKGLLLFLFFFSSLAASEKGPIVLIVGTRPEAVKVIPVYNALKSAGLPALLCSTGQHKELLDDMLHLFGVTPDFDLKIMKQGQDLFYVTEEVLKKSRVVFEKVKPSLVIVQGDTTSAMGAALSAYYLKIPVAHIEAGLRTDNIYAPFPEEMNRLIISRIAALNFAPTELAASRLKQEGIKSSAIFLTGNPVVDALYTIRKKIQAKEIVPSNTIVDIVESVRSKKGKLMLLTAHRRENFGQGLKQIFSAVRKAIAENPDLYVVYPMHPNPNIKNTFDEVFHTPQKRMITLPPLPYHDLVYLLDSVDGVATDSGGIQEEAISLNKTTLILRNETDRPEGLAQGFAMLVGDSEERILAGIDHVLRASPGSTSTQSPYGDGHASEKIQAIVQNFYQQKGLP